jgi:hypothetical protein
MPCTRMAIPLRFIATGESHVLQLKKFKLLDPKSYTCYYTCNMQGGEYYAKETYGDHRRRGL